jgi:hypothetical protein
MTTYKDKLQLKLSLLNGDKGLYAVVDTYKKPQQTSPEPQQPQEEEENPF